MAKIEESTATRGTYVVRVDANEVVTRYGKKVPYPTWIGTINKRGTINVWTPSASVPRHYKEAAKRMLEDARDKLCEQGKVACKTRR
jgi:hypothetical protein